MSQRAKGPPSPDVTLTANEPDPMPCEGLAGGDRVLRAGFEAGARVARYVIEAAIGEGGMGRVYRAHDPELDRAIAIKVVRADRFTDAGARDRLLREARTLAQLSHPNVVTVHDVGTVSDEVYVAMELVTGPTLKEWLGQPRERREILAVFEAAGRGLLAAHRAGVVHRDFKPSNVILGEAGEVKVVDFGLARPGPGVPVASDGDLSLTRTGQIMGTPGYMAPEQVIPDGDIDVRTDQFAFCVALFEALCRKRPFDARTLDEVSDVLRAARRADRSLAPEPDGTVPAWLYQVLARGLHANPDKRFVDMGALLVALGRDPFARRRRFALGGAGLVAVAGAAVAATLLVSAGAPALCEGFESSLTGVWDPAAEAAVRQAFAATGAAGADGAFARVSSVLDDYAAALVAMRGDNCRATRIRGEQTPALMDLRTACMDRRLLELDRLVEVLASPRDAAEVSRSVDAVYRLSPLDACADAGRLTAASRARDQVDDDALEAIEGDLARAHALLAVARHAEAKAISDDVLARARALGHRLALAQALHQAARVAEGLDDWPAAAALAKEGIPIADAAGDDELRLELYAELIAVLSRRMERDDDARAMAAAGDAVLQRGGDQSRAAVDYLHAVATMHYWAARNDASLRAARRGLEISQRVLGPRHPDVAKMHNLLAINHDDLRARDDALEHMKQALDIMRDTFGADHLQAANFTDNYGNMLDSADRHEEAIAFHEKAEAILARETPGSANHGRVLLNLARCQGSLGRHQDALATFDRGEAILVERFGAGHTRVADLLDNKSGVLSRLGRHDEAIATARRAVDIHATRLGAGHPVTATSLRILSRRYRDAGRLREALHAAQRAVVAIEESRASDDPLLVPNLEAVARSAYALGDERTERAALERAQRILEAFPDHNDAGDRLDIPWRLAQLLPRSQRDRAVVLARGAREHAVQLGYDQAVADIDAWLDEHAVAR